MENLSEDTSVHINYKLNHAKVLWENNYRMSSGLATSQSWNIKVEVTGHKKETLSFCTCSLNIMHGWYGTVMKISNTSYFLTIFIFCNNCCRAFSGKNFQTLSQTIQYFQSWKRLYNHQYTMGKSTSIMRPNFWVFQQLFYYLENH